MATDLTITRVYRAPPQRVWDAWTQPEQLVRWWGKRGWDAQADTIVLDVRPGGIFRVTTVNGTTGAEMTNDGVYTEVDPPHRLSFGDTTVTFTPLEDGRKTEMHFHTTTEATKELFERMRAGMESALERLEEALQP